MKKPTCSPMCAKAKVKKWQRIKKCEDATAKGKDAKTKEWCISATSHFDLFNLCSCKNRVLAKLEQIGLPLYYTYIYSIIRSLECPYNRKNRPIETHSTHCSSDIVSVTQSTTMPTKLKVSILTTPSPHIIMAVI